MRSADFPSAPGRCSFALSAFLSLLMVCSGASAQRLTLSLRGVPFEEALHLIEVQSPFRFVYAREDLSGTHALSLEVRSVDVDSVLTLLLNDQPLSCERLDNYIILRRKRTILSHSPLTGGRVLNEEGQPVVGASIYLIGQDRWMVTDGQGRFSREGMPRGDTLLVSAVGYQSLRVPWAKSTTVVLRQLEHILDETVVIGYGTTTRRLLTGSVSRVARSQMAYTSGGLSALASLQGRATGVLVSRTSGLPDAPLRLRIRGQGSPGSGSEPLYLIDGVPSLSEGLPLGARSGLQAMVPFEPVEAEDLESVEILKDADATAIYGSRGAGGVVLLTTRRAAEGKAEGVLELRQGWEWAGRTPEYLSTAAYLRLRREGFANDGVAPTPAVAPDLTIWDSTEDRRWKELLLGQTARSYRVQGRVSGTANGLNYTLSGTAGTQGTVYPGTFSTRKASLFSSGSRAYCGGRLLIAASLRYGTTSYELPARDLTAFLSLPPNMYAPYDASGRLQWSQGGVAAGNPLSAVHQPYSGHLQQFSYSTRLEWKLSQRVSIQSLWGGHGLRFSGQLRVPIASQDPSSAPLGSESREEKTGGLWVWEPSVTYRFPATGPLKATLLSGATLQQTAWKRELMSAQGYRDDALIGSPGYAGALSAVSEPGRYRYSGGYARLTGAYRERYLLQLTLRRDGSSRFGPGQQFGNFGAVGGGWLFYREKALHQVWPWLSFGKLRLSFGTAGNDQIGEGGYRDQWAPSPYPYDSNGSTWRVLRPGNPDFSWEKTRKWETALELGTFQDRLLVSAAVYRHRSSRLILRQELPAQSGFTWVLDNTAALVENRGLELEASFRSRPQRRFAVRSRLLFTLPQSRLLSVPLMDLNAYSAPWIPGKPLHSLSGYRFLGVDPSSGLYRFEDVNGDGRLNRSDEQYIGSTAPRYFGSVAQEFSFKGWTLDVQLYFLKARAPDPVYSAGVAPGDLINMPVRVENRWRRPGDEARYQRATQDLQGEAYFPSTLLAARSSAALTDASFLRVNELHLAYRHTLKEGSALRGWQWFLQLQNAVTLSLYPGDPETQNPSVLPPLRTLETGIQFHF